jgi:hypothetical protein
MKVKITSREFRTADAERLNDLLGGVLERNKAYVKRILERAETDESFRRHNEKGIFNVKELAGYISIAEYGNEKARKSALVTLYNLEDWHGTVYTKYGMGNYIRDFYRKPGKMKSRPIQGSCFNKDGKERRKS